MSSDPSDGRPARRRQSIPLQLLGPSPDGSGEYHQYEAQSQQQQHHHTPSRDASPATARMAAHLPGFSNYWDPSYNQHSDDGISIDSPIDPSALQAALPPEMRHDVADAPRLSSSSDLFDGSPYIEEVPSQDYSESDRVPLTAGAQPISGSLAAGNHETQPRDSFQTVSDVDNGPARGRETRSLGHDLEYGHGSTRHRSYGMSLTPGHHRGSHSPSPGGALLRAGSIVRAMSQRVVNISGESEIVDQQASQRHSRSPRASTHDPSRDTVNPMLVDTSYRPQSAQSSAEKAGAQPFVNPQPRPPSSQPRRMPNPLKGMTLGIFAPDNRLRLWLCDLLVKPYTEPAIMLLIVAQTILLAVESAPDVFSKGHGRPDHWGTRAIDWALLGLFIVFTFELFARIIVSGFVLNAAEHSTIDRSRGIRAALTDQYRAVFQPQRQKSVKGSRQFPDEPPALLRSFTTFIQGQDGLPETFEDQQRFQLARRAFLRHSFNRLDCVAVLAYWIAFGLGITGLESRYHIYIFKMMSCLRILRLLALTHGTAIILRSLKKATPLLIRVAFLISFFWLLFAIIGIQSFKASLSRQCVWLDPLDPTNLDASYTNEFQFCGGYLDNNTGETLPWVIMDKPGSLDSLSKGSADGKGFLCPRGSMCLQQNNPYNGTLNFDNIFNSLELVFVIMSANTFSDLMYYTMGSDYSQAALFFGAGIMIMMLWLTNLLIAVITSSFQVIREEQKSSAFTGDQQSPRYSRREEPPRRLSSLQRLYDKTVLFWILVIAFGLIAQACRSASMSDSRHDLINAAELAVTIVLDVEIAIRIAASWREFHQSWRNLFDLGVAVITTVLLIPPIRDSRPYAWLSIFQLVRAYRIVLAVPVTRTLILLVLGNAAGIANLMLFVFLMTFLMAILAAQLFRGEIPVYDDGQLNRISFYTIYNSFLGMYQILTSENWTEILYTVTSYTKSLHTSWIGAVFLMGWFILAFFILINMFIAVIQENFDVSEDEKRLEQVKSFLQRKELGHSSTSNLSLSTIFGFGRSRRRKDPLDYGPAMMEMLLKDAVVREFLDDRADSLEDGGVAPSMPSRSATTLLGGDVQPGTLSNLWGQFVRRFVKREPNPFYSNIRFDGPNDTLDPRQMARQVVSATSARRKAQREYIARHPSYNNSLYIFRPKSRIRRLCQRLVGPARGFERFDGVEPNKVAWYSFSAFIYACIVAMVVLACVTTPLYQKEYQAAHQFSITNWYAWTDLAFALVFTVEAIIKIVADGFIWTPNAYMRSSWGIMDSVVLITLWINVVTLLINDGAISRAVGAFKALRALRLLNVSDSARDTFHSLIIVVWWKIVGAAFVSISLLIPFAIYGLNLFNGMMVSCNDSDDITILNDCFGEFSSAPYSDDWPMLAPRVASNDYFSFDDFGSSLFTLFQIVSQEGWTDVSFAAQAITGRGNQPQDLASPGNGLFFVAFNLLGTVFVLTLFISVFMRNYTEHTGVAFLTAEQRSWLELRKLLRHISPSKSSYDDSEKTWKKWCHKRAIEKRGKWYQTVTVVLVLHLILLIVEFKDEPKSWAKIRELIFLAFILFYVSNVAIRIIGLGWARFRRSSWDLYSLAAVGGAFIATLMVLIADSEHETFLQLHKIFLVAIVLLVIPRNDALDQLFKTAAASLTVIGSLLATWLVLFLVFAIAMTQAFSLTRFGPGETNDINFRTVPRALILLFRMSLGEGWNQVMEEYADIEPPLCVEENNNFFKSDCGSKPWARFLFVAWNLLSMYIFVNLFVSLIYESFSYVFQRSSGMAVVDRDEIRRFKEAWRSVDPTGSGSISKEAFPRLLGELSGIFQMRVYDSEDSVRQILEDVRSDVKTSRHTSIATTSAYSAVDLDKLNERLARLDVDRIRDKRRLYNIFCGEVMVSADPDTGISFTNVLMILAHYNIINDSKSLKLEEFLRRRARLQRVDEEVRRKVVQGFFDTLYWSRRFKKHLERKRAARMTAIPQLDVPHIFVEEDEDNKTAGQARQSQPAYGGSSTHLSVDGGAGQHEAATTGLTDMSAHDMSYQHPLSQPRSSQPTSSLPSGFSFELYEPETQGSGQGVAPEEMDRRGSAVASSPVDAQGILDDSIWMDSIRRSATTRRSGGGSYRY